MKDTRHETSLAATVLPPERWARLQAIFAAAADLSRDERDHYLDRECANDPTLRLQVESLLLSLDGAGTRIGNAVGNAAAEACGTEEAFPPGSWLGPYQIVRPLGHGGMGAVYLAVRADDQFRKQVAVKIMRAGWHSPAALARFRTERQILADLEHPYIARLLDGGTVAGAPYVAMEYVDGVPIDQYAREGGLTVPERLRLFRQLLEAVAYAHRNLIIHRDIKPGNVLVSGGVPKLLDFGIAKLLGPDGLPETLALTEAGERLMTPDYASPEQVRGETITTASDIYSLGVLLYELVTGERPFQTGGQSPGEMERAICTQDPERPSTRAARRELAGDLDNVILMAMRKEPERRYASVDQFSEDIRRYLEGFPVSARRDTWGYRASKFVGRHKLGVVAAAALAATIVGFGIGMGVLARRAAAERDTARTERNRAEQVSKLLLDTFRIADPAHGDGNRVTAREILDRGADQIERQAIDGGTRADMLDTLGEAYQNLGIYDRSRKELEEARDLRLKLYGAESAPYALSLHHLGVLLQRSASWAESEKLLRAAIAIRAREPEMAEGQADSLAWLSVTLLNQGRPADAETAARESLAIRGRLRGSEASGTADTEEALGTVLMNRGKVQEAEPLFRDALNLHRRELGEENMQVADLLEGLGKIKLTGGDYQQAEQYFRARLHSRPCSRTVWAWRCIRKASCPRRRRSNGRLSPSTARSLGIPMRSCSHTCAA